MTAILLILFVVCSLSLAHTYIIYPILVSKLSSNKDVNTDVFDENDNWPHLTVLMAAYNEESIIAKKIDSLLSQSYDGTRIQIYIASDHSSDKTDSILSVYEEREERIHVYFSQTRTGKPGLINILEEWAQQTLPRSRNHIYILTDANVILENDTLHHMVKHFKNKSMGLVDAHMIYHGMDKQGIAIPENTYLHTEVSLKQGESKLWKKMIGPFGGCYALRSDLYSPVPTNHLVDDFYIAMKAFEAGADAINAMDAKCYEAVSHYHAQEYKRKKRISAGNWQNLFCFKKLLNPFSTLGFALISHKVLRWLGPFLLLGMLLSSLLLFIQGYIIFKLVFGLLIIFCIGIPLLDRILSALNIHINILRTVSYFILMNVALLHGFVDYLKGIDSGVWQPTERTFS